MKIKILKQLNDTLYEGRIIDISKDVAFSMIREGNAEAYEEAETPNPKPKNRK